VTRAERVGRSVALRLGRLIENKKNRERNGAPPLWWPPFYWGTQQSTMSRLRRWGGRWRGEAARAERVGGGCLPEPGVESKEKRKPK
jgi:hypothetical protein